MVSGEALTRETRYERYGKLVTETVVGRGLATAEVLRCKSCGSLLAGGDEDLHERLHPHVAPDGHAWDEQFR